MDPQEQKKRGFCVSQLPIADVTGDPAPLPGPSTQGLVDPQEHKKRGGRRGRGTALGDDDGSDGEVRMWSDSVVAGWVKVF